MTIKTIKSLIVAVFALLFGSALCGAADLVAVPRATSLIVDQVKLLTDAERGEIEVRLKAIQESGRAQVGILISSGTGDEALAPYALRVAEAWKLGTMGLDNGLLILIVPSKKAARVEVGYGLEGDIPDARAAALVLNYVQLAPAGAAAALNATLDKIENFLPHEVKKPRLFAKLVEQHADWKLPIVMLCLSVFTLFPLLFTAAFASISESSGDAAQPRAFPSAKILFAAFLSAALFAGALGFGAMAFWDSKAIGYKAAAIAFALPLLWSLSVCDYARMGTLTRLGYALGRIGLFAYIFTLLTVTLGAAFYVENVEEIWMAPLAGLLFGAGPLALSARSVSRASADSAPGVSAGGAIMKFVAYLMYFIVALGIVYLSLSGILRDPTKTAVIVAGVFTALLVIAFTLDDREKKANRGKPKSNRTAGYAWMFTAAAVLFILPFTVLALVHALVGEAFTTHLSMFMAGDGTFSDLVWWASGALGGSVLLIGLGGKFGGGGAGN